MSAEVFMERGGNKLTVHILKKINEENFIGGDDTKIVHLKTPAFAQLVENQSYTLIKPEKFDDNTIVLNPKFKPIKTQKIHLSDKRLVVEELERKLNIDTGANERDNIETLDNIATKPDHSKITKMTVKCLRISKIIQSPYGEYRIGTIRDFENNKCDINLNKHTKNKMEVEKTYHIENFKVSDYRAKGTEFRRLSTLSTTLIKEITKTEENKYSHIRLGDEEGVGNCIGIGRTFGYFGCKTCWKKVEGEAAFCAKCNAPTADKTKQFSTQLYIEIEDDVYTFLAFASLFPNMGIDSIETEEIEEILENAFVGKKMNIEFNEGKDDETKQLVKINKVSKSDD